MIAALRYPSGVAVLTILALLLATGVASLEQQAPPQVPGQPFRTGVDVIEVDVSVLDKDRRPVRDLKQTDFTVLEDGRPQPLVSFALITAAEADPTRSARMRFVPRDVVDNNLAERIGNGRLFAIVLDDMNLPADDSDIVIAARDAARHIVDQLGPSDQASIVFVHEAGKTQDFTNDQRKLLEAIDRFVPHPPDWIAPRYEYQAGGGGDMPYRYSPLLARSVCMKDQPAVPTLDAATNALTAVQGRRKTLIFISPGLPVNFEARDKCGEERAAIMKGVFRKAQRANINLHGIDPSGYNGYRDYMEQYRIRNGVGGIRRQPPGNIRQMHDFLKIMADHTGGRYVLDTDAVLPGIDRIFEEESSYYLVGYEALNPRNDGRFRKIEVKVNRPGVSVRSRSGYWAAEPNAVVARERSGGTLGTFDFEPELSGLTGPPGVALRATAVTVAPRAASKEADVVVALSVRWPPIRIAASETLAILRNIYDPEGRTGPPTRETVSLAVTPGDEMRHDLIRRLALPPGRHEIRFNVASTILRRNGSVYVEVEVPDFSRTALAVSGLALGAPPADGDPRAADLAGLLPIVPTSARDFANGETVMAFVRVQQGGEAAPGPVSVTTEIFDAMDRPKYSDAQVLAAEAFGAERGAPFQIRLPLDRLEPGPHLLSLTARLANGRSVRRDLLFLVR